ncbi:chemotaxis protein CheB [Streptomyces monomycini]|uniref:chemotaxis protein CheB n=1 Tax=Streptomyces monomycini TaxID=371720 RepID=UPI0035569AA1
MKARSGTVVVQDRRTADFPDMPQAAVDAGVVDHALPPDAIERLSRAFADHVPPRLTCHPARPQDPVPSDRWWPRGRRRGTALKSPQSPRSWSTEQRRLGIVGVWRWRLYGSGRSRLGNGRPSYEERSDS